MQSTLSSRRMSAREIESYAAEYAHEAAPHVELPTFARHAADKTRHSRLAVAPAVAPIHRPHLVPSTVPQPKGRRAPLLVRFNRVMRTALVACCGLAIVGYGFDVAVSSDVGKLQDQARRLNEQNSELSAQLLKAISFQGIQDSVLGRFGLRVPEQVLITKELPPPAVPQFEATKHHFPIMSGY